MNPNKFPANGNVLPPEVAAHPTNLSSNGGRLRNRLPEIAASPIYSESGGAPGRKFFMSIHQHQNVNQGLICGNENEQLRLSQIQNPQPHGAVSPDQQHYEGLHKQQPDEVVDTQQEHEQQ